MTSVLQADGVCFSHGGTPLIDRLSFSLPAGVALVRGGDGRGKTTLLGLLAGDLPASSGRLNINGSDSELNAAAYRQQVFWPQGFLMSATAQAWDQTPPSACFAAVREHCREFDDQLLATLVAGLGLIPHLEKPLYMLSTGSRRKVWTAAALAAKAPVTLLDEPFAALDKASIACVLAHLTAVADTARQSPGSARVCVVADYIEPAGVPLVATIDLGD